MKLNVIRSQEIAKAVKAQKKQCYINAFHGMSLVGEGAYYVEGYAAIEDLGIPLEHGWIEIEDEIIDPTWVPTSKGRIVYQPLLKVTLNELIELLNKYGRALPVLWKLHRFTAEDILKAMQSCVDQLKEE